MTTPTLESWLASLEEVERKATAGPWSYDHDENEIHSDSRSTGDGEPWHIVPGQDNCNVTWPNAEFIAASRSALPKLVSALRAAVGALEFYSDQRRWGSVAISGPIEIRLSSQEEIPIRLSSCIDQGHKSREALSAIDDILKGNK